LLLLSAAVRGLLPLENFMHIDSYLFGRITVDGRDYTSDVILYPDRVDHSWWRKEGHVFHPEDVPDVLNRPPDILIIGTGYFGVMRVPKETLDELASRGIEVKAMKTAKAVEVYNSFRDQQATVVAALHITC
jgi:hypothetical protein